MELSFLLLDNLLGLQDTVFRRHVHAQSVIVGQDPYLAIRNGGIRTGQVHRCRLQPFVEPPAYDQ